MTTLALSAEERSQAVRPSYMVLPVKRLPSKPWSGWPRVRGMSAAVMPMRTTDWASAPDKGVARSPAKAAAPAKRNDTNFLISASVLGQTVCVSRNMPAVSTPSGEANASGWRAPMVP